MNYKNEFLIKSLEKFNTVPFTLKFNDGEIFNLGKGSPKFTVIINNEIPKYTLLTSTSLALGEAYMNKDIEIDGDLFFALDSIISQIDKFDLDSNLLKKLLRTSHSPKNQKKEVCSHYNIGNDFYSLWLDKTLSYSCAYFKEETNNLYDAQLNKVHHILNKLNLQKDMTILDIGCGFGFLLIEAAKKFKTKGIGITLSEEQFKEFQKRIISENLEDYIEVKLMDYRDLRKLNTTFDRVVSVGMLEHVGRDNYPLFLKNIDNILKPNGLALLHFITSMKESNGDPWIKKYIFPGGVIPSLREIVNLCPNYNFHIIDIESLRIHYMKTLLCWYNNFRHNIDKIQPMFDDKFIRMWELYLCSCAAAFHSGNVDLHQILISKNIRNDLPLTREYMN